MMVITQNNGPFDNIVKINTKQAVRDMPKITKPWTLFASNVIMGRRQEKASRELVHTNLCGPTRTQSLQGKNYFMPLIDDYSRMSIVAFLKDKSKSFEKFKAFKALAENETDLKIKCLRSYKGSEFILNEFEEFCELHRIRRRVLAARTP